MTFADELLEISDDLTVGEGDISPVYNRMDRALDDCGARGLVDIQRKVREVCWQLIPADVILAPTKQVEDEVEAMMAAIFTIGVIYGREHALRGYTLPSQQE
jgi:hypothetical protein